MIRRLLATTAVVAAMSAGAYAQDTQTPAAASATTAPAATNGSMVKTDSNNLASNIIGQNVYNGAGQDASKIGDVNDLLLGPDGKVKSVIVGVGGFLGIGEKDVAINYSEVKWTAGTDTNGTTGNRWLVANASKESLQALPAFDRAAYNPNATAAETAPNAAAAPAATAENSAMTNNMAATPDTTNTAAIDRSKLTEMPADQLTADNLIGTNVYGANDADVGEIADIVLDKNSKVDAILIDVGGFLGIGAKRVAVGMDKLKFMQDGNGNRYLYTALTKDQLQAQTEYNADSYASDRDKQRMTVQ